MVQKELHKVLIKPLALTASIVGLLEGIAWTVFSALCISCYHGSIEVTANWNTTNYFISIYNNFLFSDLKTENSTLIITPKEFFIFMCFYVVLSAIWFVVSGFLMWTMIHNQWQLIKYLFGSWSAVTILNSIIDVLLTALLARDYKYIEDDNFTSIDDTVSKKLVTYGIVMSLAARGYILWIINVVFASVMIKFLCDVIKNEKHETRMPIIHGYESSEPNQPWSNDSANDFWPSQQPTTPASNDYQNPGFERSQSSNGYQNHGFERSQSSNGYQNHGFERSQSFLPIQEPPTNREESSYIEPYNSVTASNEPVTSSEPNHSFTARIAQKFAKIGRNKGRRSPPNPVPPPFIPDPDYTPPGSPTGLKSVLRAKSNYA